MLPLGLDGGGTVMIRRLGSYPMHATGNHSTLAPGDSLLTLGYNQSGLVSSRIKRIVLRSSTERCAKRSLESRWCSTSINRTRK